MIRSMVKLPYFYGFSINQLMENIPEIHFFSKDLKGAFTIVSESFAKAFGMSSAKECIGKTDFDLAPSFMAEAYRKDDKGVMRSGIAIKGKIEIVPVKRKLEWFITSKVPIYNSDQQVIGLAGTTQRILDSDKAHQNNYRLKKLVDFINENYSKKITVIDFAKKTGVPISTLEMTFRKAFGVSPIKFLKKVRLYNACVAIQENRDNFQKIAENNGFIHQSAMTRDFKKFIRITPSKYSQIMLNV